jgi:hypothetical protein
MEIVLEFGKLLIPALLVLYAMYLTVKNIMAKDIERKEVDLKIKNYEKILPMRLQAYERIALLLERISPNNIMLRLNNPKLSAKEFQIILVKEIRDEFNHNLSQQIYVGADTWVLVKKAIEDTINLINQCAINLKDEAKSVDLMKAVFGEIMQSDVDSVQHALSQLKKEVSQFY